MALQIKKDTIFEATVMFLQDNSTKKISFRLPRQKDFYVSRDGNTNYENIMTLCNMALPFEEPVMVSDEEGQIVPITTLKALYELDVTFTIDDVIAKWKEATNKALKDKANATKKSRLAGNSTPKDTPASPLAD